MMTTVKTMAISIASVIIAMVIIEKWKENKARKEAQNKALLQAQLGMPTIMPVPSEGTAPIVAG